MTYINPNQTQQRSFNAYTRFKYPDTYKELFIFQNLREILLYQTTKKGEYKTRITNYEFVNVWPQNMQSIRISYGQSSIMRCSVALAYDRFFTDFTSHQSGVPVANWKSC